ncbi:hypothetical protein VULLAG_LOCUS10982 [Vulpes lagopus]
MGNTTSWNPAAKLGDARARNYPKAFLLLFWGERETQHEAKRRKSCPSSPPPTTLHGNNGTADLSLVVCELLGERPHLPGVTSICILILGTGTTQQLQLETVPNTPTASSLEPEELSLNSPGRKCQESAPSGLLGGCGWTRTAPDSRVLLGIVS